MQRFFVLIVVELALLSWFGCVQSRQWEAKNHDKNQNYHEHSSEKRSKPRRLLRSIDNQQSDYNSYGDMSHYQAAYRTSHRQLDNAHVTLREGELVRSSDSWQVYVYKGGTLYPIPDTRTFHKLGYSFEKDTINEYPDSQLKLYHIGAPLGDVMVADVTANLTQVLASTASQASMDGRGVVLCAGSKQVPDALGVIHQYRHVWKSKINITIAHCAELSNNDKSRFEAIGVNLLDMCASAEVLGMDVGAAQRRLRGFFCKTAALILSPYRETMITDLDVVWFKNPDTLFSAPQYVASGALFFRDKHCTAGCDNAMQTGLEKLFQNSSGVPITPEYAQTQLRANGYSLFWRHLANRELPCYINFQDSSVIVFDRHSHRKTLQVLTHLLPQFSHGYGDKEIYWVAATVANEPFAFEPYLVGTYGDCGVLLHFDPSDAVIDSANALPLYINAEYIIEKIGLYGSNIEFIVPNPVLANDSTALIGWGFYQHHTSCGCYLFGCRDINNSSNVYLLRAQWERITRGWKDQHRAQCMTMYKPNAWIMSQAMRSMIDDDECTEMGCVYTPIYVNNTYAEQRALDRYCNPVSFEHDPPLSLLALAQAAQLLPDPPKLKDLELVRGQSRQIYVYFQNDTSLHPIENWTTFVRLGYDVAQVVAFQDSALLWFKKGYAIDLSHS